VRYLVSEAVGQFNYAQGKWFDAKYRRAGDVALQEAQALRHAQAHEEGMSFARCSGVIAWCAFDYGSLINSYDGVKCPGVADVFRIPKLGASFYRAQVDPKIRPVIEPNFYWEFGPRTPRGPGKNAAIFSNCDRLQLFIDGKQFASLQPDRVNYGHLKYPPFFCDLEIENTGAPGLRIDGYGGGALTLSKSFSPDTAKDQFLLEADDRELIGDGSDSTRLVFKVADRFGALRASAGGQVSFTLRGPGVVVGDNPFLLTDSGGAGAIWIRTTPRSSGRIAVKAAHSFLGAECHARNEPLERTATGTKLSIRPVHAGAVGNAKPGHGRRVVPGRFHLWSLRFGRWRLFR
jgi:beta-galactosidase